MYIQHANQKKMIIILNKKALISGSMISMGATDRENEGVVSSEKKQQIRRPFMYKVLLHNDDYTTMDFVVMILEKIFHKSITEASQIMLNIHEQGRGVAGVYPRDVAETKMILVYDLARQNEYPLKCSLEKA
jgi:ATP-dependent Clp protease adaptor protein ClpS